MAGILERIGVKGIRSLRRYNQTTFAFISLALEFLQRFLVAARRILRGISVISFGRRNSLTYIAQEECPKALIFERSR